MSHVFGHIHKGDVVMYQRMGQEYEHTGIAFAINPTYFKVKDPLRPDSTNVETVMLALDFWKIIERDGKPYAPRSPLISSSSSVPIPNPVEEVQGPRTLQGRKPRAHKARTYTRGSRRKGRAS